jgi:hypothetical protein
MPHGIASARGRKRFTFWKKAIAANAAFTGASDSASFTADCRYIATEASDAGSEILGSNSDPHQATNILN